MTDETVIAFSDEIVRLLDEYDIDIIAELKDRGTTVTRGIQPSGDGSRDATLILLASSVTIASSGWAIAKVIDAISRGKRVMLRRFATSDGAQEQAPLFAPEDVFQDQSRIAASFNLRDGIKFELISGKDA